MVTTRQRHLAGVFREKYGVIGAVAGKYVKAGCSVKLYHPTRLGVIEILAKRGGETYAIGVYTESSVQLEKVKLLHERAKLVKAKPVVVLYGGDAKLNKEAYKYCVENNIKVKRVPAP